MKPEVRVFDTVDALSSALAAVIAMAIQQAVGANGRCSIALSGGNTPRTLHRILASDFRDRLPWHQVHVFWADERYVPHDDVLSNYRMAKETLLDHVPCPSANIFPMPTDFDDPALAATAYDATLQQYFDSEWPDFDIMLLGVGDDGHTASLFPGLPVLEEQVRWVQAVTTPAVPQTRLTLTMPAINHSSQIHVIVTGLAKAFVVRQVLEQTADADEYPAVRIDAVQGSVTWWLDRHAAKQLVVL